MMNIPNCSACGGAMVATSKDQLAHAVEPLACPHGDVVFKASVWPVVELWRGAARDATPVAPGAIAVPEKTLSDADKLENLSQLCLAWWTEQNVGGQCPSEPYFVTLARKYIA